MKGKVFADVHNYCKAVHRKRPAIGRQLVHHLLVQNMYGSCRATPSILNIVFLIWIWTAIAARDFAPILYVDFCAHA